MPLDTYEGVSLIFNSLPSKNASTWTPLHRFAWRVGLTLAGFSTILHFKYNPVYNPDKDLADFQLRECRKDVSSGE